MTFKIINKREHWDFYYRQLINPGIYASYDYCKAAEILEKNGETKLAIFEKNKIICFHPFIKRSIEHIDGIYDIVSPYDFGGFWFNTKNEIKIEQTIVKFFEFFFDYCKQNMIITEFIRFHPFQRIYNNNFYSSQLVERNVIIKLSQDEKELYKNFSSSLKRNIKKAHNNNLKLKFIGINAFIKLYYETMDYLQSKKYYYFPKQFFEKLTNISIIGAFDKNGRLCSSQIYLFDHNIVFYFLGGSNRNELNKRPNDFLFHQAILHYQKNFEIMHLGGGSDSLLKFKKKFSRDYVDYYIGKKIFNNKIYNELIDLQEKKIGKKIDQVNFFPKYRFSYE